MAATALAGAPTPELLDLLASIDLPEDGADSPLGEASAVLRATFMGLLLLTAAVAGRPPTTKWWSSGRRPTPTRICRAWR